MLLRRLVWFPTLLTVITILAALAAALRRKYRRPAADALFSQVSVTSKDAPEQFEPVEPIPASTTPLQGNNPGSATTKEQAGRIPPLSTPREQRSRPPEQRGGRPRGPSPSLPIEREKTERPPRTQTEIVCWESQGYWVVGIEVSDDADGERLGISVEQDGKRLIQDERFSPPRFRLETLSGSLAVLSTSGEHLGTMTVSGYEGCFLFKLAGNEGRQVSNLTSGSYLAIVPATWRWDEATAGQPPVAPEPVSVDGFQAYFFSVESLPKSEVAFATAEGGHVHIHRRRDVQLVGKLLPDYQQSVGPLFAEKPPLIASRNVSYWDNIKTVIVGAEGRGRRRWRTRFTPQPGTQQQILPDELQARPGGWYFVRLYDYNDRLVDSLDFRFLSGLSDVQVEQHPALPPGEGHRTVVIDFMHSAGCSVQVDVEWNDYVTTSDPHHTRIELPPRPECDSIQCEITCQDAVVGVKLATRRVWWALGEEDIEPQSWVDEAVDCERKWFTPTSTMALWLRLPVDPSMQRVFVGLSPQAARPFRVPSQRRLLCVPLREFGDSEEVEDPRREAQLSLWLDTRNLSERATAIRVIPRFRCLINPCGFESSTEREIMAHVKTDHLGTLVRRVTDYQELRSLHPEFEKLPRYIHRCLKCGKHFATDDNRPDRILDHECSKIGPAFEVIRSVDRIRRDVIHTLPEVHVCRWGCVLKDYRQAQIEDHVLTSHRDELYRAT